MPAAALLGDERNPSERADDEKVVGAERDPIPECRVGLHAKVLRQVSRFINQLRLSRVESVASSKKDPAVSASLSRSRRTTVVRSRPSPAGPCL